MEGAADVLRGRCLPYGEGITYWPLVEMLIAIVRWRANWRDGGRWHHASLEQRAPRTRGPLCRGDLSAASPGEDAGRIGLGVPQPARDNYFGPAAGTSVKAPDHVECRSRSRAALLEAPDHAEPEQQQEQQPKPKKANKEPEWKSWPDAEKVEHLLTHETISDPSWTDKPRLKGEKRHAFIRRILLGEGETGEQTASAS